jgi:two-component system nitrate/nitrite response regulator NarL
MATAIIRGAHGVIPKAAPPELLLRSLREVASGQKVLLCPILDTSRPREDKSGARRPVENQIALTKRECEITQLVCEGLSNKEVARRLHLSDGTIRAHLHRIYQKLAIENRTMLVMCALRDSSVA